MKLNVFHITDSCINQCIVFIKLTRLITGNTAPNSRVQQVSVQLNPIIDVTWYLPAKIVQRRYVV